MVPARLSSFVNLSFSPLEPGNFYKRVYLLLRTNNETRIKVRVRVGVTVRVRVRVRVS